MLIANFIAMFAFSIFILGFQTFTNDILKLTPTGISLLFVMFGVVGLIMQGFATGKLVKKFGEVPLLIFGVGLSCLSFFIMGISTTLLPFVVASIMLAVGNSFLAPLITAILSKHTRKEDQGGMMGISQAYGSLANIIGPVIGGALAVAHVSFAFYGAGLTLVLMFFLTMIISRESGKHEVDL
jgi:MFS family permease